MDDYMQQIHELKRSLALEKANSEYMSAELESIHATHDQQNTDTARKHAQELEKYRQEVVALKTANQSQEEDHQSQIRCLREQIETLKRTQSEPSTAPSLDLSSTNHHLDQIQELTVSLQEAHDQITQLTGDTQSLRLDLEHAKEKVSCLEETLQSKREEALEREQTLEQFQDTVQELRAELMQLQAEPDATDCNRKGNSLFAEVSDQRQQVMHLLGAQNRSFKEMKKAYRQSEAEIRQLKEENALMLREIDKIKSLFLNANKTHSAQQNRRIADLHRDLGRSREKAQFLEEQVKEGQVSSVLEFFRKEGESMQLELAQSRMQKCEMNDQLQAVQVELAQWRFQCLKQKCVLIDREMRLEANGIPFETRCSVPVDETVQVSVDEVILMEGDKRAAAVISAPACEVATEDTEGEEQPLPPPTTTTVVVKAVEEMETTTTSDDSPVDCEIVEPEVKIIDLSVSSPQERLDAEMDMSMDGMELATAKAAPAMKEEELTTASSGERSKELASDTAEEGKGTGAAAGDCFINLDFLLDDLPSQPQRHQKKAPQLVDLCFSPVVASPQQQEENKENEEQQQQQQKPLKKKNSVTKLNYKAISNNHHHSGGQSILVKRTGAVENSQKNVQFAADVHEAKDLNRVGGGCFIKQEPGSGGGGQPKKAFKVNFRRIHSKPAPSTTTTTAGEGERKN